MIEDAPATQPPAAAVETKVETTQTTTATDTGKGGPAKPWMAQLKKELQADSVLSQYDDFSSVAERLLGFEAKKDRLLEIPAQDAPNEVKAAFRTRLGVPDKPESYEFEKPELPKGSTLKWDDAAEGNFRKMAHELGLNKDQAKALFKFDTERQLGAYAARQKALADIKANAQAEDEKFNSALKTAWGNEFEANKAKAVEAAKKTSDAELMAVFSEAKLPSGISVSEHPKFAEFFFNLDQVVGDTPFIRSGKPSAPSKPGFKLPKEVTDSLAGLGRGQKK